MGEGRSSERTWAGFAWGTLLFNLVVILWGAYVRASGSGAGCGGHWPLCNGQVVPRSGTVETLIELVHRVTSAGALVCVGILAVGVFRSSSKGHPARKTVMASAAFVLVEAAVGAALVLFGLVGQNASAARAVVIGIHLTNTFLLLAGLTLTAHLLSGGTPLGLCRRRSVQATVVVAVLLVVVGATGAVAARGDTLYPASSLSAGIAQDTSETASTLLRLRLLHPAFAILVGGLLIGVALWLQERAPATSPLLAPFAGLLVIQLLVGLANVYFLAPIPIQILHLFLADAIWIAFVLIVADALRVRATAT